VAGTLSSGAGTSSADFTFGTYFGAMTGRAAYPYNPEHSIDGDRLNFVLPASYDLGTQFSNTNAAMYGVDEGGTIRFSHMAGVMRFVFRNVPSGTDRFTITMDKKINGTFTADLASDFPVLETEATSDTDEQSVTLNFDALTETSDIRLYIPLPLGTYNTIGLSLCRGAETVWTYSNTVSNTISRKSYTRQLKGAGNYFFNTVAIAFAIIFFIISAKGDLEFPPQLIPYAMVFGACFGICNLAVFKAISCGPLALTSLFMAYSTIIPTLYGILFLKEHLTVLSAVGIAAILLAVVLLGLAENKATEKTK
jgi:uncharacterized membrane protein